MFAFKPSEYGPAVSKLLAEDRLCELGPGHPNSQAKQLLNALRPEDFDPQQGDRDMADCCVAGLWLWHDYLARSHDFSQEIHTPSGSYWHAIMHRREPDYSNSKYWYRRVGDHEIFPMLQECAAELAKNHSLEGEAAELAGQNEFDPFAFVDLCASVARGRSNAEQFCRELAQCEWQLLFDYCYRSA